MSVSRNESEGRKFSPRCLKPRQVVERSFVNSVTELVCSALSNQNSDPLVERIEWASFIEESDLHDPLVTSSLEGIIGTVPPVLLVIGFMNGYQIWGLLANGECEELLSARDVPVNCVKMAPVPKKNAFNVDNDQFLEQRPLFVVCDGDGSSDFFPNVTIHSLKCKNNPVKRFKFDQSVLNIFLNEKALIILFQNSFVLYDVLEFAERFNVQTCVNPMTPFSLSLSSSWLAFADNSFNRELQSCGGVWNSEDNSCATHVVSAALNLGKTVAELATNFAGLSHSGTTVSKRINGDDDNVQGAVTILNFEQYYEQKVAKPACNSSKDSLPTGIVAHFLCNNSNLPASYLQFSTNGSLLVTSTSTGQRFDLFLISAHPQTSCLTAVQHLYILQRGSTIAKILDINFSPDSRWIAVSTANNTTHLFPITPYGGSINVRTHCGLRPVNRESRFYRSAGLDALENSSGSPFPAHTHSQVMKPYITRNESSDDLHASLDLKRTMARLPYSNPRLPPFPPPVTVLAASKIKLQPLASAAQTVMGAVVGATTTQSSNLAGQQAGLPSVAVASQRPTRLSHVCSYGRLKAYFGHARAPTCKFMQNVLNCRKQTELSSSDVPIFSLFIVRCNGQLNEYEMAVKPCATSQNFEKISDDHSIDLHVVPTVEWNISRSIHDHVSTLPLPLEHPFIQAHKTKMFIEDNLIKETACSSSSTANSWVMQLEASTYMAPHRRLWMGPQFTFKTYKDSACQSAVLHGCETNSRSTPISIGGRYRGVSNSQSLSFGSLQSIPVMLGSYETQRSGTPLPAGADERSLIVVCGSWSAEWDFVRYVEPSAMPASEVHLREKIADAMRESTSSSDAVSQRSRRRRDHRTDRQSVEDIDVSREEYFSGNSLDQNQVVDQVNSSTFTD